MTDTIGRAMEGLSRGLRNGIRYGSDAMNAAADNFAQRQRQAGNTPPFHNQGTGSAGGFTQNQGEQGPAQADLHRTRWLQAISRRIYTESEDRLSRRIYTESEDRRNWRIHAESEDRLSRRIYTESEDRRSGRIYT
ncbi:MAG: hypothetical protein ACLU6F_12415 [[Ruminococcus] torques]